MMPFAPLAAVLPLFHLCLVKIVRFIVVIVFRYSVLLALLVGMIAVTVAVATMVVVAIVVAVVAIVVAVVAIVVAVVVVAIAGNRGFPTPQRCWGVDQAYIMSSRILHICPINVACI
jgi:hypothetical protein